MLSPTDGAELSTWKRGLFVRHGSRLAVAKLALASKFKLSWMTKELMLNANTSHLSVTILLAASHDLLGQQNPTPPESRILRAAEQTLQVDSGKFEKF